MKLIKLGNRVIKMASRPVFIDYHSILATFPNPLYDMILKNFDLKAKRNILVHRK